MTTNTAPKEQLIEDQGSGMGMMDMGLDQDEKSMTLKIRRSNQKNAFDPETVKEESDELTQRLSAIDKASTVNRL